MGGTVSFKLDWLALILLLISASIFIPLWRRRQTFAEPSIYFPDIQSLPADSRSAMWTAMPTKIFFISLIALSVAFINPLLFIEKNDARSSGSPNSATEPPHEGIAIYLILDQSGSMKENIAVQSATQGLYMTSKIDLFKEVSREFIIGDPNIGLKGRPNDLIGLIFFARAAKVMVPLTLDHRALLKQLDNFDAVGSPEQDGTSIGYALYKTVNMIVAAKHYAEEIIAKKNNLGMNESKETAAYTIKNSIMILITDGLQDPNPLDKGKRFRNIDVPEAAAYAKENGIRLYIINVEPQMAEEQFVPYQHIMQKAATLTGGQFYMVDTTHTLEEIYKEIDSIEKSAIPMNMNNNPEERPDLYQRHPIAPYLIVIALISLLIAIILETILLRRIP